MTLVADDEPKVNPKVTRLPEYRCTRCGREAPRDELTVKRASFHEMGANGRRKASRTTDWLCPDCLSEDKDWNRPPKHGAFPAIPKKAKK